MQLPEVHTTSTLSGHAWGIVGPGRALYVVSMSEVARVADRAVQDNMGMYDDPDEAMQAIASYIKADLLDRMTPEG